MTLRVASTSASEAGAISTVTTCSFPRLMLLLRNGSPSGFKTEL